MYEDAIAFRSALQQAIAVAPMPSASLKGWQDWLRGAVNRGDVKESELQWTGFPARLEAWAAAHDAQRLTRETVQEIAEAAAVRVMTLTGDEMPAWQLSTLRGITLHETAAQAMYALEDEHDWIDDMAVEVREAAGTFTVHSHEDEDPMLFVEGKNDGRIVATFAPGQYWHDGTGCFGRDTVATHTRPMLDSLDEQHPADAPHDFTFLPDNRLILRDCRGQTVRDAAGQEKILPVLDAEAAAEQCANDLRAALRRRLDKPQMASGRRSILNGDTLYSMLSLGREGSLTYSEVLLTWNPAEERYRSPHWAGVNNVIAHIRMTDLQDGTLFVEELQSDWAQGLRRGKALAAAPFVDATGKWLTLALKQTLHEAVSKDAVRVAFVSGAQATAREALHPDIARFELRCNSRTQQYRLDAFDRAGQPFVHADGEVLRREFTEADAQEVMERVMGRELTERLRQQEKQEVRGNGQHGYRQVLAGQDLVIAGDGMKAFYDRIVPNTLKVLLKKLDPAIRLQSCYLLETGSEQLAFDVTNTLRDKVRAGQPLFSFAPAPDLPLAQQTTARDATDNLPQYRQTRALLDERLGAYAASLITLTDRLPNGTPLLQEGAHTRADGQTCINPARIAPLHDAGGKEILSRDERVLWVAHHELFHRGVSVRGGQALAHSLQQADSNTFVHTLTDAILRERQTLAPETAPRNRLEAVEEALAELHAARESGRMDALQARYLPYAPGLILPQQHDGWRGKLGGYADDVRGVLRRLTRREVSMTDAQVAGLLGRVGAAATRVPLSVPHGPEAGIPPMLLPVDARFPSPREAGRRVWEAINGDPNRLPEAVRALEDLGYALDLRRLQGIPQHPVTLRDAFMAAVRQATTRTERPQQARQTATFPTR